MACRTTHHAQDSGESGLVVHVARHIKVRWDGGRTSYFSPGKPANARPKPFETSGSVSASKQLIEEARVLTRRAFAGHAVASTCAQLDTCYRLLAESACVHGAESH